MQIAGHFCDSPRRSRPHRTALGQEGGARTPELASESGRVWQGARAPRQILELGQSLPAVFRAIPELGKSVSGPGVRNVGARPRAEHQAMRKAGKLWKRSRPPVIDWTDRGDIRRVRKALAERRIFAEPEANSTELVQTHISSVLLTPNFIFKFKRPLNLGFVDLSGLRQRRHYSEAELRLNRRLVRRVYLGVATLREKGGRWQFEPSDRIGAVILPRTDAGSCGLARNPLSRRSARSGRTLTSSGTPTFR